MERIDENIWKLILKLISKDMLPVYGLRRNSSKSNSQHIYDKFTLIIKYREEL